MAPPVGTSLARPLAPAHGRAPWRGEPLAGRTILVYAEQGLGDCIQFIRFAITLQGLGAQVVFRGHESMRKLMSGVPGVSAFNGADEVPPPHDYQVPVMSLFHLLGASLHGLANPIPYVSAVPEKLHHWRNRLGPGGPLKIGLSWAGSPSHSNDHSRSMQLKVLAPLLEGRRYRYVSLQIGPRAADIAAAGPTHSLEDLASLQHDLTDTVALMECLDLDHHRRYRRRPSRRRPQPTGLGHAGVRARLALDAGAYRQSLVPQHALIPPTPAW